MNASKISLAMAVFISTLLPVSMARAEGPAFEGWYRLKTQFRGDGECLEGNQAGSSVRSGAAFMDKCQNVSGQLWKLVPEGTGYRLRTQFRGDGECLEGNQAGSPVKGGAAFMDKCQNVSGQLWRLEKSGTDAPKSIQLRSVNYPDRYVRHRDYLGELTPVSSDLDKQDSSFFIRPGLSGQGVSFESVNFPGFFLRHQDFQIKLQKREETPLYKQDASFNERGGLAGKGKSYESVNFPGHYLRHCTLKLYLDNNKKGNAACDLKEDVFKGDVSFEVVNP